MGSFMVRGNQYIELVKVLYCKLLTIAKKLPSFLNRVITVFTDHLVR